MILLVSLLILIAVGFFVTYPLWWGKAPAKMAAADPNADLIAQKEATYASLKELEFDYILGNLNPQDHSELERRYKDKAVSILKRLDAREEAPGKPRTVEGAIEAEVARLRRAARETRPPAQNLCPHCQTKIAPGANYCPYCGSSLTPPVCPQCAAPYRPTDRFCSQCGTALPQVKRHDTAA